MKKPTIISAILFFSFLNLVFAQPKTNLEIIYNLVEKNVDQLLRELPHETNPFNFEFTSPVEYQSLGNRYLNKLSNTGFLDPAATGKTTLNYSLEQIKIEYSEPFRDGLLGNYLIERNLSLTGTYAYKYENAVKSSEIIGTTYSDTLSYSDIEKVEINHLSFTHGTKPHEPVFESLLEPVIAVGAVIVTIILLFTVRSK